MKNKTLIFIFSICFINIRISGEYDYVPKKIISQFLPKNPIIVEAGAHIGVDTEEMAIFWPEAKIYSFEPVPHLFKKLENRTSRFQNVYRSDYALSNNNGRANFFISSGASDGSSSLLNPKEHLIVHPNVLFNTTITVKTITLDHWAMKNNIDHVDMLWLDLQGAEPLTLKASPHILSTVKVIYTEVNLVENYEGADLYSQFKQWLEEQGFRVEKEAIPWSDGGNVLFVRN